MPTRTEQQDGQAGRVPQARGRREEEERKRAMEVKQGNAAQLRMHASYSP